MNEKEKKRLFIDRMLVLQGFVESYLKMTKGKTFEELYPDIKDEYGHLNAKQEELLHDFLSLQHKLFGLDLDKVLEERGARLKEGSKLTDFEMEMLARLADQQILIDASLLERKSRLYIGKMDNKGE